jgi:hypothetical protein
LIELVWSAASAARRCIQYGPTPISRFRWSSHSHARSTTSASATRPGMQFEYEPHTAFPVLAPKPARW